MVDAMKAIRRIRVSEYTCQRCGYVWRGMKPEKPRTCANQKCRSVNWDRPRRKDQK